MITPTEPRVSWIHSRTFSKPSKKISRFVLPPSHAKIHLSYYGYVPHDRAHGYDYGHAGSGHVQRDGEQRSGSRAQTDSWA